MRLLFDTMTLIWAVDGSRALRPAARTVIGEAEEVVLSVASLWEIAIKVSTGKLEFDLDYLVGRGIEAMDATILPVLVPHALGVRDLPFHHRDPFDRLLIAQARHEGLTIMTNDPDFHAYDVEVVW
jgi:PIN domain nuclease of toxin-antitoxin system